MDLPHIGLIAHENCVDFDELVRIARALQKQVSRDLAQLWRVNAIVTAFPSKEAFEPGCWPLVFAQDVAEGEGGYHLTSSGKPMALVQAGPWKSVIASHECLEMIVDPFGNQRVSGRAQGGVPIEYLLEICDPCVAPNFAYPIDDVWVSEFVTPDYYNPQPGAQRFSCAGRITGPAQILPLGYLTWRDPRDGSWHQWLADSQGEISIADLGSNIDNDPLPARELVDLQTPIVQTSFVSAEEALTPADKEYLEALQSSRKATATFLDQEIRGRLKSP